VDRRPVRGQRRAGQRGVDGQGVHQDDAKYVGGTSTFVIPADLDPAIADHLAEAAVRTFRALGCAGLLRVDFFVHADPDGRLTVTVNEVNTMPGFTAVSQFPQIWQVAGTAYPDLLDLMIMTALKRGKSD
jgi:D-alanine-D-alanine ligase